MLYNVGNNRLVRLDLRQTIIFLNGFSVVQSVLERVYVGVFDLAVEADAARKVRDFHAERFERGGEIGRRQFALRIGIGCKNDFFRFSFFDTRNEFFYRQIFRAHALLEIDHAVQNVIRSAERARVFDRIDVFGLRHDANGRRLSRRANFANVVIGIVAANATELDVLFRFDDGSGECGSGGYPPKRSAERGKDRT